jgi:hypothetical protein
MQLVSKLGRAMVQAVSRRPQILQGLAQVRARFTPCRICG